MFLETSALTGENVEEAFLKCSRTILSKIESGKEIHYLHVSIQIQNPNPNSLLFVVEGALSSQASSQALFETNLTG